MNEPEIKAVKDYAQRGYASAGSVIKPGTVFVDRQQLLDRRRRPRRFSTEHSAMTAARRSLA